MVLLVRVVLEVFVVIVVYRSGNSCIIGKSGIQSSIVGNSSKISNSVIVVIAVLSVRVVLVVLLVTVVRLVIA